MASSRRRRHHGRTTKRLHGQARCWFAKWVCRHVSLCSGFMMHFRATQTRGQRATGGSKQSLSAPSGNEQECISLLHVAAQAGRGCTCVSLCVHVTNFSSHSNINCGYSDVGIARQGPQQQALCSEGIVRITCFASDRAGNATSAAAMMRVFTMLATCTFAGQFISP
jgi:hypothetical protein